MKDNKLSNCFWKMYILLTKYFKFIVQIANLTGHNLSTIKAIYRIYKNEGRIYKKEKRDKQTKIKQNVIVLVVDEKYPIYTIIVEQDI